MRYRHLLIPTLKETPNDAEVISHQLMVRAGMIRKVAAGIYSYLPLGLKVIRKFETIVREEMNRSGAQEVFLPSIIPSELWQESGRWDHYGKELLRVVDRHDKVFCYGPTHEEVITDLVRQTVKSYRDLPINLYQIQTKFRDEIRPRFGLMRGREFGMKDSYSFHANAESLDQTYADMQATYHRIFKRCGLDFRMVKADSGAIGGDVSAEFMVLASTGEDAVIGCNQCDYAANVEAAGVLRSAGSGAIPVAYTAKTDSGDVLINVCRDRVINEIKLKKYIGDYERIEARSTSSPVRVIWDTEFDIVNAQQDDPCIACETGRYHVHRGIETGHVFKLGTKYSEAMGCLFTHEDGSQNPMLMGCYGIGIGRTVAASIEQNHDEKGIIWPPALAPFQVSVVVTNAKDAALLSAGESIYQHLTQAGFDALFDDRSESAGVKFKDFELIGIPALVVVGKNWVSGQLVEVKDRRSGAVQLVTLDELVNALAPYRV